MSRLDSAIRRLSAQRDCLAAGMALAPAGPVLEIGLGNGRTYDHLREIAPGRDVWVIDREMNAHPSCTPPAEFFLRGEAGDMLAALHKNHGRCIALVHYDLGVGVAEQDVPLRAALSTAIRSLMVPGGILVANGAFAEFDAIPLPAGVQPDRYFMGRLPQS